MLYRKIESLIENHLKSDDKRILLIDGARQVGKTYIIRCVGKKLYPHFVEINLMEDALGPGLFKDVRTVEDFYLSIGAAAGTSLGEKNDTLIFLDEIQAYPALLTLLKFLREDNRFSYIASGSLLGVTLAASPSIPMGSIRKVRMYPLDFEEFLYANGFGRDAIESLRHSYETLSSLPESMHERLLGLFKKYLLSGGLPDAVNAFVIDKDIVKTREIQNEIREYYASDASRYDSERRLKIRRIYSLLPSNMENRKKRLRAKDIEGKENAVFSSYLDEFDYLASSGIALAVQAVSTPAFPLSQSSGRALIKLYLNDPGLLSAILYGTNIKAVLSDERSINLGALYETAVAGELSAHGFPLFYYDNRNRGEVDFLIDDYAGLSTVPLEVKSGRDYTIHSALSAFVSNPDYGVKKAFVLSNSREVIKKGAITYIPIYYVMFFSPSA